MSACSRFNIYDLYIKKRKLVDVVCSALKMVYPMRDSNPRHDVNKTPTLTD